MKSGEIIKNFKNEVKQKKISASYLFYGDKRVDLLHYALEFSKLVMINDMDENDEEKFKIEKKIENFQHPDIEIINKNNENIKIDEVREIIYSAIESSYNSPKKIFILCGIENLRKESSNALLKIIEEPPKNVYFILLSKSLNIISTIKSRTIKFHLESLNNEELGVSKEEYYFFDGNENDIQKWKLKNKKLEDYNDYVKNIDDVIKNIVDMKLYLNNEIVFEKNEEIDLIVKYNKSIEYLCKKIKLLPIPEIYILINELEKEYRQEKNKLIDLLGKILVISKNTINVNNFKKLINIKNSIRSNVNIRSILFNFFEYLQE